MANLRRSSRYQTSARRGPDLSRLPAIAGVVMLGTACTVSDLDVTFKSCPCAEGWLCDTQLNACLPVDVQDDGQANEGRGSVNSRDPNPMKQDNTPPSVKDSSSPTDVDAAITPGQDGDAGAIPHESGTGETATDSCAGLTARTWFAANFESYGGHFVSSNRGTGSSLNQSHDRFSYEGKQSLRVETTGLRTAAAANHVLDPSLTECTFRIGVYLFVEHSVKPDSFSVLSVDRAYGGARIALVYTREGLKLEFESTATTMPLTVQTETQGRWMHFELYVRVADKGEVRAYVDTQEAARVNLNTNVDLGYSALTLGITRTSQQQGPVLLYADKFVVERANMP